MVDLLNEGARDAGFQDTSDLWRAGYDMPPQGTPRNGKFQV